MSSAASFISSVQAEKRGIVERILKMQNVSNTKKLEMLAPHVTARVHKECQRWLEGQRKAQEEEVDSKKEESENDKYEEKEDEDEIEDESEENEEEELEEEEETIENAEVKDEDKEEDLNAIFEKFEKFATDSANEIVTKIQQDVARYEAIFRQDEYNMKQIVNRSENDRLDFETLILRAEQAYSKTLMSSNRLRRQPINQTTKMKETEEVIIPVHKCVSCMIEFEETELLGCVAINEVQEPNEIHYACFNCIRMNIEANKVNGRIAEDGTGWPCFEVGCKKIYLWASIRKLLKETTIKYLEKRFDSAALREFDEKLECCKSCEVPMFIDRGPHIIRWFDCQNEACRTRFCRICKIDFNPHQGKTCDEADPMRKAAISARQSVPASKSQYRPFKKLELKKDGPNLGKDKFEDNDNDGKFRLPPSYFNDLPPVTNILILGSIGVGKSTFINSFINYLSFESIQEAMSQPFHVLIKTVFTHTTEDLQSMRIEVDPTIRMERCRNEDEEDTQVGHLATQSPNSYLFKLGPMGQEKFIRIIDTPGVGDVRGTLQDQKHFTKILNYISNFDEIHAILFLLEPNIARLNIAFRYCIKGLLSHLHASAAENLIFGFTKARMTFYRPGDSYGLLKSLLDDLYDQTRIRVPLNGDNMFCFDNEGFRFLCALKNGAKYSEREISDFSISWNKAVEQNFKVFDRIKKLRPHQVSDTLSVNNIRRLISTLAHSLAEIAKNQLINMHMIDEKNAEIEECIAQKKDLRDRLFIETVNIETEELFQPITVCTHKDCVEYKPLNNGGVVETIYNECHSFCYLDVETGVCPNPDLLNCEIFIDPERCSECGHSWQFHMHMKYRQIQNITRTRDPLIEREVRDKDSQIETARRFIAEQQAKREERQVESDKIQHYCAHFAAFLKKYSIVPYNDSYLEYLDHLIKEEKNKFAAGGSDAILKELESFRDAYDQQRLFFSDDSNVQVKSLAEINKMIKELESLTFNGEIVQKIQNLKILSVKKEHHHNNTAAVPLESSFIRRAFLKTLPRRLASAFTNVLGV